jgi:hypothetical protein
VVGWLDWCRGRRAKKGLFFLFIFLLEVLYHGVSRSLVELLSLFSSSCKLIFKKQGVS